MNLRDVTCQALRGSPDWPRGRTTELKPFLLNKNIHCSTKSAAPGIAIKGSEVCL